MRLRHILPFAPLLYVKPRTRRVRMQIAGQILATPFHLTWLGLTSLPQLPQALRSAAGRWMENRRWKRWLIEQVGDVSPEQLIETSRYGYARWQGECYVIFDKAGRSPTPYVGFAPSIRAAERMILERVIAERGEAQPPA